MICSICDEQLEIPDEAEMLSGGQNPVYRFPDGRIHSFSKQHHENTARKMVGHNRDHRTKPNPKCRLCNPPQAEVETTPVEIPQLTPEVPVKSELEMKIMELQSRLRGEHANPTTDD